MRRTFLALVAVMLAGCDCGRESNRGSDGGDKVDGGDASTPFSYFTLDPQASARTVLSMAIGPNDRVGVAYFSSTDGGIPGALDGGGGLIPNWDIRYVEWSAGNFSAPERIVTVQRVNGLSLAFQANGEPAVAYLGGGSDNSTFWFQSDAVVSYRSGGTWTEQAVATMSNEAVCGNVVSDNGFLVGLNPGLTFSGATAFVAWRDAHTGQNAQDGWAGSDLEVAEGGPTTWNRICVMAGGDNKQGYGGHIHMIQAAGQPALVHDRFVASADGTGQDVIFVRRQSNGAWTSGQVVQSVANTQSGASLGWDPVEGYSIAVIDRATDLLTYTHSMDGQTWTLPTPVYQAGTGGWWPSLAFDPINHEPAIAYYVCSARLGMNEESCTPAYDGLVVTQRIADIWREVLVDSEGGYLPKLGFLSSGRLAVAYRNLSDGTIRLAVER
ncbi:MAG: hypothetical protein ACOZIN_14200 [Myxococcota bacterium]